jgi:hypothetical protein
MGTFLSQKPSKIVQYGTHTPSNWIILVSQSLIFQPTLEYLSKISILRSNFLEIIQSKLKEFPVLVRKIFKNSHSHKGEVEILVFNRAAETQLRPRPKDFGKYEWAKIYTCTSDCHNSGSILKSFDFFFF